MLRVLAENPETDANEHQRIGVVLDRVSNEFRGGASDAIVRAALAKAHEAELLNYHWMDGVQFVSIDSTGISALEALEKEQKRSTNWTALGVLVALGALVLALLTFCRR